MKTILLTGGTGFVGANLARRLIERGDRVNLLVRPGYAPWRIATIRDDISLHVVDLRDRERLRETVRRVKPDWIFHLAACGAYCWQNDIQQILSTNVNGTANLVQACLSAGFDHFVNAGSSSEYGFKRGAPSENERLEPNSHYAVAKAIGTQYCRIAGIRGKRKVTTLRLYSVYGPFEEPRRFIPTLLVNALHKRLPCLVDPETARDFIFVDDFVDACLRVAGSERIGPGVVFNVGTGISTTIGQAVDMVKQILQLPVDPQWGTFPRRSWDTTCWVADIGKIKSVLGWTPETDLRSGLQKTLEWFRLNPEYFDYYRRCLELTGSAA